MVFTISVTALPSRTDATISHDPVPELGEILANGGEWRGEVRGFRNVIETDDAHRRWHGDPVIAAPSKRASSDRSLRLHLRGRSRSWHGLIRARRAGDGEADYRVDASARSAIQPPCL